MLACRVPVWQRSRDNSSCRSVQLVGLEHLGRVGQASSPPEHRKAIERSWRLDLQAKVTESLSNSFWRARERDRVAFVCRSSTTTTTSFLLPLVLAHPLTLHLFSSRVAALTSHSCRYFAFLHHATARAALSHPLGSWHEPYFSRLLVVAPSPVLVPRIQESWHARAHVGMSRHWSSLLFAPEESVPQKSPTASFVLLVNPRS